MQNREPALPPRGQWVWIERQSHARAYVGPYQSEAAAVLALNESLLIEALCEEDSLNAGVLSAAPRDWSSADVHIIDPTNPDHTGTTALHQRIWSGAHKAYVCTSCTVDLVDVPGDIRDEYAGVGLPAAWEDCTG